MSHSGKLRKVSLVAVGALCALIILVVAWFAVPFSPLRRDFDRQVAACAASGGASGSTFAEADIAPLPEPVRKYFVRSGFIGKPKTRYMGLSFKAVRFVTGVNGRTLTIDYDQYNFADEPVRLAFIDSSLFGIPFQGFDSFVAGKGRMKGVVGKAITLFDQTGPAMDKSSLVTFLSESLMFPSAALRDYTKWEPIDATHAKAVLTWQGMTVSGTFAFNDAGEMVGFYTDDREAADMDGTKRKAGWSVVLGDYVESNGIRSPTSLRAVWHFPEGDLTYFDAHGGVAFKYF